MTARIPADFPVRPLTRAAASGNPNACTCGTCGRSWDDSISTGWTPAPSGRCPFEYFHAAPEVVTARHPARADRAKLERMREHGPELARVLQSVLNFLTDPDADAYDAIRQESLVRAALRAAGVEP